MVHLGSSLFVLDYQQGMRDGRVSAETNLLFYEFPDEKPTLILQRLKASKSLYKSVECEVFNGFLIKCAI